MQRALHLRLVAPMMYLGATPIPSRAPEGASIPLRSDLASSTLPTPSMLTGLIANALGYRRSQLHDIFELQEAIRYACILSTIDASPRPGGWSPVKTTRDFQTALLNFDDAGWTRRGRPEGRRGSPDSYRYPWISTAIYLVNCEVDLAVVLGPSRHSLDEIADALVYPHRPVFIGRKSCLPSEPIFRSLIEVETLGAWARETPPSGGAIARAWDALDGPGDVGAKGIELGTVGRSGVQSGTRAFFLQAPETFSLGVVS